MEAEGSECEHWRFMRAAGGRSAQHRGRDSWAAYGQQGTGERMGVEAQRAEDKGGGYERTAPPHSCGKSEVRGPGLLGKV